MSGRVDAWLADHREAVERYQRVVDDVEAAGVFDLATLAVARRALSRARHPRGHVWRQRGAYIRAD